MNITLAILACLALLFVGYYKGRQHGFYRGYLSGTLDMYIGRIVIEKIKADPVTEKEQARCESEL